MPATAANRRRIVVAILIFLVLAGSAVILEHGAYLRAASVLFELQEGRHSNRIAEIGTHHIQENILEIPGPQASMRSRIYSPVGVSSPPALLLVHGVHWLGIDEPRLVDLARIFAARGVLVMTPELEDLKNYRITPQAIDEIGFAARALAQRSERRVVVLGISFAGSLSLLAAAKPGYAGDFSAVVAVGAYDNLERVSRFLASGKIEFPDGHFEQSSPEQYGAVVLINAHPEAFFSKKDLAPAKQALQLWLSQQYQAARGKEKELGASGRQMLETIFQYHLQQLTQPLLAGIVQHKDEMAAVSPHEKLSRLRVPVFLLHGADDDVIPPAETLWLARDIPAAELRRVLVSSALHHVDTNLGANWPADLKLVSFMAAVIRALEHEPPAAVQSRKAASISEDLQSSR